MGKLFYRLESNRYPGDEDCPNVMCGPYQREGDRIAETLTGFDDEVDYSKHPDPSREEEFKHIKFGYGRYELVFGFTSLEALLRWFNANNNLHTVADIAKIGVYSAAGEIYESATQACSDNTKFTHVRDIEILDALKQNQGEKP